MADLITSDDFIAAGGDVDSPAAWPAMSAASEIVRGYLNQQVDLVEGDVVRLIGTGTRALVIPELPVVAINSVTIGDDAPLAVGEYRHGNGLLWRLTAETHRATIWPHGVEVVVNYDHGWSVVPGDVRLVVARLAVAMAADAAITPGLASETIQDYSYTVAQGASASQTFANELAVISRRVVRQVPVA